MKIIQAFDKGILDWVDITSYYEPSPHTECRIKPEDSTLKYDDIPKTFLTEVYEFGPDNDLIIKLPDELLEELKWFDGDKIIWNDNNDGTFNLRKENE